MNNETLEKHFDLAFSAPNGVKKLRELILTFAMQGKLVPQDPNDQPASELLKEIKIARDKLAEEGKFNSLEEKPINQTNALPFQIPKNWVWCYLDDISAIARGGSPRPIKSHLTDDPDGLNWIKIGDSDRGKIYINDTKEKIRPEALKSTRMVFPGDLILSNSMSFGYPYIMNIQGCIHDGWLLIRIPDKLVNKLFIYHLFLSSYAKRAFQKAAAGAVVQNLNADKVRRLLIPLPPLAEQKRIVAKIDRLMAQCDELENLGSDRNQKRITIHTAAIDRLLTAQADSDFSTAWDFIQQHFGELYSVKENVAELRKAILQLAVMGKLVPQDPNDEPASELLKAIGVEKQRLVKEGKIKELKRLPEIKSEAFPYYLPKAWVWVRLEDIVEISSGVTKGRKISNKEILNLPYLRVANVQRGYLDLELMKEIEIAVDELPRFELKRRDLLITEGGDWDKVGRAAIWNAEIPCCIHQNHVFKARCLLNSQNEQWLEKYLNSSVARAYFADASKQTTNLASINKTQLRGCPIPIPPLAEQYRIVAKINQLMDLCDELEKQIDAATDKRTELLNALMAQV
jgi:type I restriction enzyme, S subunit